MKPTVGRDERRLAMRPLIGFGQFDSGFHGLSAAIAKEAVLQIPRGNAGEQFGQQGAGGIQQTPGYAAGFAGRSCCSTAATTLGCRWPTLKMPNPPRQSIYSRPYGGIDQGIGTRSALFNGGKLPPTVTDLRYSRKPGFT